MSGHGMKPPGKARRVWGIITLVVGVLPVLIGAGLFAANVKDARITKFNDPYADVAWHNLKSDVLFPDKVSDVHSRYENPGWVRQGIAQPAKCDEALSGKLLQQATDGGCKTVLRATYVDNGGESVATVSLIVLRNTAASQQLSDQYPDPNSDEPASPDVTPYPVAKTPASEWSKRSALVGSVSGVVAGTTPTPYVMALSMGSVDTQRDWGHLPEPWAFTQKHETQQYGRLADAVATISAAHIGEVIRWGEPKDA
ncbi:hypothetical protein K377_06691 [Streptomyces sp. PsTaAH-137]|nr:hypothetical protein K377_06691 [Streptomyces sp. PsTaAH-137]